MKKIACLVLSLVLCLSMLCAVAEVASPSVTTEATILSEVPEDFNAYVAPATAEEFDALDKAELLAAYGETDAQVAAYEAAYISVENYVEGQGDLTMAFDFASSFTADQNVKMVLYLAAGPKAYDVVDGTVTFDEAAVAEMAQAPVMYVVLANVAE